MLIVWYSFGEDSPNFVLAMRSGCHQDNVKIVSIFMPSRAFSIDVTNLLYLPDFGVKFSHTDNMREGQWQS